MKKERERYCYSPSDLAVFMGSPFASWMQRYSIERPENSPQRDDPDPLMELLQKRGYAQEETLEEKFVVAGKSLTKISRSSDEDALQRTIEAMQNGVDVIVQGRLAMNSFAGFADFLVKIDGPSQFGDYHYEAWDTKLSSILKPSFLIQLCCYSQMLEVIQGVRPQHITVAQGDGTAKVLTTNDYFSYYESLKGHFLREQQNYTIDSMPDPADSKDWGDWSTYANRLLEEGDHLCQVATITRSQIKKLNAVGIKTVQQLVESEQSAITSIAPNIYQRLHSQASIQLESRGKAVPLFKILKPQPGEKQGLALLPPQTPLDVFFDIEGFPLDEGGLEYLWGSSYFDENSERQFIDFWAHDRKQEEQCFKDFIAWVYERWERNPSMHIYHYASYEISACRKLMGRYGVCEFEVDQLLRNEVFVDLYKIVKGAILLGEPRYSIKNVEHLYRGKRNTEVGSGGDSVVVYERWRELHAQGIEGSTWQDSAVLEGIRDYNIDDCDSTQELTDWLRIQQRLNGIEFLGKSELVEVDITEEQTARTQLRDRLLIRAEKERVLDESLATITENLAWSLEFHRRESKPVFWRLFDRLGSEEIELIDDLDCLAFCQRTHREPYKIKRSWGYEYQFDYNQEFKAASSSYYVLGEENEKGNALKVNVEKMDSDFSKGLFVVKSAKAVPPEFMSLIPDEYVNPIPIPQALMSVIENYEKNRLGDNAIVDFLARAKPRIVGHYAQQEIAGSLDSQEKLQQIVKAVVNLNNSYLPIQGPPGSGKTYTGKHLIAELLKRGKRIGICSNSHKAINNLLLSTAKLCAEKQIKAEFFCTKDTDDELLEVGVTIEKNSGLAAVLKDCCVVGTTAWGFSRDDFSQQLDYLFIDEAGQVSVANLIAVSRSTKNLVLMGDHMQLGQPTQGVHPADSGASILDYLLHESPTISADCGVFLDKTYRLHSSINRFISAAVYDNKLHSDERNDRQVVKVPSGYQGPLNKEAGLVFIPCEHEGNTQASDEEIAVIVEMVQQLQSRIFVSKEGVERKIGWSDFLFVAPYNFQVNKLAHALSQLPEGDRARVGSVDKFQGLEAPIVFLSMCASDAGDSPRGIDFLFDKNRLNVAISRAQSLAIVVANPALAITAVSDVEQLAKVNFFSRFVHWSG